MRSSAGENGGVSTSSSSLYVSLPPSAMRSKKFAWTLAFSFARPCAFLSANSMLLKSFARFGSSVENAPVRVRFSRTRLLTTFEPARRMQKSTKPV